MYEAFIIAHKREDGKVPKLTKGLGCDNEGTEIQHTMLFTDYGEAKQARDLLAGFYGDGLRIYKCEVDILCEMK